MVPIRHFPRLWGERGDYAMQMVIGAVIFAVGAFFGAWFYAAGQQSSNKHKNF